MGVGIDVLEQDQETLRLQASEERARLAAARLDESEARFRSLADSAPIPIWVSGPDAGCEFVNKAYLDFFGKTLPEVQGFGWTPHAHPEDEARCVSAYLAAFAARTPIRYQARWCNASGEYRWMDSVGHPRFAQSGDFLGYVGASLDITEAKRAEFNAQFINELDLALSRSADSDEIVQLATRRLGEYLGVRACHVGEIDSGAGLLVIREKWEGWRRDTRSMVGEYRMDDYASPVFREALARGEIAIVEDFATDPRTQAFASRHAALGMRSSVVMPILHDKHWRAVLNVGDAHPRRWRADESQLVRDVASRLWLAVTKARALEALRESERRARRTLADQMVAGVASVDAAGRFTMVNPRYCDITGYSEAELLSMSTTDVTHPEDSPHNAALYRRLFETGEGFFIEKRYRRKDGGEIWVNAHTSPIRGPQGTVVESSVSVVVDVTDRRRIEEELAAAKDRLAADLSALQGAYERVDAATRAKDEFLAVVSHELRSPLSAILGYTQLLSRSASDPVRVRQIAEVLERNGKAQLQLIEDLLDTGRIISGKLKLEVRAMDLASVAARALDVLRPAAQARGIELRSRVAPTVGEITGDPDRLEQVVWNLLSNAVKFTPKGGSVDLTVERDEAHVQIIVRDNGKGMEPEVLDRIFERFWQSDMSSTRRAGGLGLGLPLVKHLVELHGGTVVAASGGTDRGATFTVRLPVRASYVAPAEERLPPPSPSSAGARTLAGLRVMIVDDDDDVRSILALTLEEHGAETVALDSGRDVRKLLAQQTTGRHFDLLICDIGMPQEDGYDVIRKVRVSPPEEGGAIPAIALTAYGRAQDRVRALEAGFQMHIVKPVDPDELMVVIRSLVNRFGGQAHRGTP
jgi:PAS domain S-box-containing protein